MKPKIQTLETRPFLKFTPSDRVSEIWSICDEIQIVAQEANTFYVFGVYPTTTAARGRGPVIGLPALREIVEKVVVEVEMDSS